MRRKQLPGVEGTAMHSPSINPSPLSPTCSPVSPGSCGWFEPSGVRCAQISGDAYSHLSNIQLGGAMPRREKEVRNQVEREEGPIPDEWWRDLVEEDYVGRAQRSPSDGIPLLVSRVRTLKRLPPWEPGGLSTRTTY